MEIDEKMTPEETAMAIKEAREFISSATKDDYSTSIISYERKSLVAKIAGNWFVLVLGIADDGTRTVIITPFIQYFTHTNDMISFIAMAEGPEALTAMGIEVDIVQDGDDTTGDDSSHTLN